MKSIEALGGLRGVSLGEAYTPLEEFEPDCLTSGEVFDARRLEGIGEVTVSLSKGGSNQDGYHLIVNVSHLTGLKEGGCSVDVGGVVFKGLREIYEDDSHFQEWKDSEGNIRSVIPIMHPSDLKVTLASSIKVFPA